MNAIKIVNILEAVKTPNGLGGNAKSWNTVLTCQGYLDKLSGEEVVANHKKGIKATHILIVFGVVNVNVMNKCEIDGVTYEITDVDNPLNMNHHLEIMLLEQD